MILDQAIYEKYYLAAKRQGVIWTINDYADRKGYKYDDEDPYENSVIEEHGKAIEEVLALEISIFVFRRLNGTWGEVIDTLAALRNQKINAYRTATGYEIDSGNSFY